MLSSDRDPGACGIAPLRETTAASEAGMLLEIDVDINEDSRLRPAQSKAQSCHEAGRARLCVDVSDSSEQSAKTAESFYYKARPESAGRATRASCSILNRKSAMNLCELQYLVNGS